LLGFIVLEKLTIRKVSGSVIIATGVLLVKFA